MHTKIRLCFGFLLLLFCSSPLLAEHFSSVTWANNKTLELGGYWDFYWDQWIYPQEFENMDSEHKFIPNSRFVPDFWNLKGFPVFGKASLRKVFTFEEELPDVVGLSLYSIYSAYKLYINDQLIIEKGSFATQKDKERGDASRTVVFFNTNRTKKLDIVFLMSNYSYKSLGGIGGPPLIGNRESIEGLKNKELITDYMLAGSLGFMSLYLICLFFFRRKNKAPLFLGLFSFLMVLRQLMISGGKNIFVLFPRLDVQTWNFLQAFAIYPILPLLSWYLYSFFHEKKHKKIVVFFTIFFSVLMLLYWFPIPYTIQSFIFTLRDVFIFLGLIHCFIMVITAVKNKVRDAKLVLIGFLFVIGVGFNDILFSLFIIESNYYLNYGVWFFLIFQSIILAQNFNQAFLEVETLSISLEKQADDLKALDKMKDEFLANTSHELKTPLNGIIGIAESLSKGDSGVLDNEQKRQLELISLSGRRLFSLINDILDHATIKNKKMQIYPVATNFWSYASPACDFFAFSAQAKNIAITCKITPNLPLVLVDPQRLEQILYNLIGNALKFTNKGSITVSAYSDAQAFYFSVKDTGIGIPIDKQADIFNAFQQADGSISRQFGGTGLGLSIVKELVELHSGSIRLISEPGKGTEFIVSLALAQSNENKEIKPGNFMANRIGSNIFSTNNNTKKKIEFSISEYTPRILIVDDEPLNLEVLEKSFTSQKMQIDVALNGQEALTKLKDGLKPDVILLDIMMPELSGYDVLKEIRKKSSMAELPVVLLTAKNQIDDLIEGFSLGANDFLTKPFSREELFARINTHIELKFIHDAYNKFVPYEFIHLLGKERLIDLQLGNQIQKDITVMFSDIRSFSSLSEQMSAKESFNFINSYLSRFGPIIRAHGGFVDKYIGDGIMALFPSGSDNALLASKAMRQELEIYNRHRISLGYPSIEFGIGIHSGSVILGTVGESQRMETTVISDVVNVASRLETLTKILRTNVLVSDTSLGNFVDIPSRFIGKIKVKGKKALIDVSELLFDNMKIETLTLHNQAMTFFNNEMFNEAEKSFSAITAINPHDYIAQIYTQKAKRALENPEMIKDLHFMDMDNI